MPYSNHQNQMKETVRKFKQLGRLEVNVSKTFRAASCTTFLLGFGALEPSLFCRRAASIHTLPTSDMLLIFTRALLRRMFCTSGKKDIVKELGVNFVLSVKMLIRGFPKSIWIQGRGCVYNQEFSDKVSTKLGLRLRGRTEGDKRQSAVSAVSCENQQSPAKISGSPRKSAFPNALFYRKRRKSAKISENLRLG